MIQEVAGIGVVVVHVKRPPAPWHGEAEVILDVAFARQGSEADTLVKGKLQQRAAQAVEGRRLVVISVVPVQRPPQMRDADAASDARVKCILTDQPTIVDYPEPGIQGE